MATHPDAAVRAFDFFIERHSTDFRRISGASRGEWKIDDVRNEAWLIGFDLGESRVVRWISTILATPSC